MTVLENKAAPSDAAASSLSTAQQLRLIQPYNLLETYTLTPQTVEHVTAAQQVVQQVFPHMPASHGAPLLETAVQQLSSAVLTTPLPRQFETHTALKSEDAQAIAVLMDVQHVTSPEPVGVVTMSLLQAGQACLELLDTFPDFSKAEAERLRLGFTEYSQVLARSCDLPTASDHSLGLRLNGHNGSNGTAPHSSQKIDPQVDYWWVWVRGHWIFLVFIQSLILSLRRFGMAVKQDNHPLAETELRSATRLMWAAGSAMKLSANFEQQIYMNNIRPVMSIGTETSVVDVEISGFMFWDHHYLVNIIWKREIRNLLQNLPETLRPYYTEFAEAYRDGLSTGHVGICARFGGRDTTSLFSSKMNAADLLEQIGKSRLRQLDPHRWVAGHKPHTNGDVTEDMDREYDLNNHEA